MDDYKIALGAILDANVKGDIDKQLKAMNDLSVIISKATLSTDVINDIKRQLSQNGIDINLVFGNTSQITSQAQQVGRQIGKLISDSAEQAISNVSSENIGRYFRIDSSTSNQFRTEMEKLVSVWTNAKGKLTDLNIQTRTSYDKDANANVTRLHQAIVTYKNELDEVIKKTIAWRQIGTTTNAKGEEKILRGFVEVAGQYSKSLDAATVKTDNFAKKQKETVTNLQNTIDQITSRAFDSNSFKPIKSDASLDKLNMQVAYVENAMYDLRKATSTTFDDAKIKVQEEISQLKILERELRNADNVSTKMKGTDVTSGISIAKNDLEKFKADAKGFPQITQTIKDLDAAISKVGDASSLNSFNDQLRIARSELAKIKSETNTINKENRVGINVSNLQSQISDLQRINPVINTFETNINGAKTSVQSLLSELTKVNTQGDFSVVNSKWKAFVTSAKAAGIAVTETVSKADKFENGSYEAKVESTIAKTKQWVDEQGNARISTVSLQKALENLSKAHTALNSTGGNTIDNQKKLKQAETELSNEIKKVTNEVTKMNAEYAKSSKVDAFNKKVTEIYTKNSAMHRQWGAELRQMMADTAKGANVTNSQLSDMDNTLNKIINTARMKGNLGKSLFEGITDQAKKFTQWFSVVSVMTKGIQIARDMKDAVYDIDTAMTNLYKVTDETDSKYNEFLNSACDNAQKLGRSVSSLVEQTANWAKLGYGIDEASKLAETSSIYTNVGEVDDATAVSDIVTALKAFNIAASDSIKVINIYNKLGNQFAVASSDIGEGVRNSASALALQGNSLEKVVAMLTGGGEITQNVGELGNMLKVASLRLASMKGKLEEINEEYDDIVSVSKNQTQIYNLTKGQVNILDEQNNKLKDTYTILEDVAKAWNDINELDKNTLLELMFGKQRANQGAAVIQAFQSGQIQKAYEAAMNAEGSAMQEQERWLQSLSAKTKQMESAFQSLSNTILDSNLLKGIVDLGTTSLNFLNLSIEKIGVLPTLIGSIGAGLSIKHFSKIKDGISQLIQYQLSLASANGIQLTSWEALQAGIISTGKAMLATPLGKIGLLVTAVFGAVKLYKEYADTVEKQKEKMEEAKSTYEESRQELESITSELKSQQEELNRLKSIKNPTYADEEEIRKLEEITQQLLIQEDLAKRAEERDRRGLAVETTKAVNMQYGNVSEVTTENVNNNIRDNLDSYEIDTIFFDEKDIAKSLAGYNEISNKISELTKEYNALSEEEKSTFGADIQSEIDYYNSSLTEMSDKGFEAARSLIEEQENLKDYYDLIKDSPYDSLTKEQQGVIDSYNGISTAIETIYSVLDPTRLAEFTKAETQAADGASNIGSEIDDAMSSANDSVSASAKEVKSSIKEIEQALTKLDKGTFTNGDLMDILEKFGDELDTSKIDFSNFDGLSEQLKEIENTKLDNVIQAMNEAGMFKTPEDLEKFKQILLDVSDYAGDFESAVNRLNDSLPTFDNLNSAFSELDENGRISSDTIVKLSKDFGNLSSFENFATIAQNSTKRTNELANATNILVGEFIKECGITDELSLATADFVANALEEKGVTNALDVVLSALNITQTEYAEIKSICKQRGIELKDITIEEANALIHESECSETAKKALAEFTLKKEIANGISLKTDGDIKNLQDLVAQCGVTISSLAELAKAKASWDKIKSAKSKRDVYGNFNPGYDAAGEEAYWTNYIANLESKVQSDLSGLDLGNNSNTTPNVVPQYNPTTDTSSKKKSKKGSKDSTTKIDYIKQSLEQCERQVKKTEKALSDLEANGSDNFYSDKVKAINDVNDALESMNDSYKLAEDAERKLYESSLSKLGKDKNSIRKKIESGQEFSVVEYGSDKASIIQDAISYYKEMQSAQDNIKENEQEIKNNNREILSTFVEQREATIELFNAELKNAKTTEERLSIREKERQEIIAQWTSANKLALSDEERAKVNLEYQEKLRDLERDNYADRQNELQLMYDSLEASKKDTSSVEDKLLIIEREKKIRKQILDEELKQVTTDAEKRELQLKYNSDIERLNDELLKEQKALEEKILDLHKDENDALKDRIKLRNALNGTDYSKTDYQEMIEGEKSLQLEYKKRLKLLENEINNYAKYSDKWNETYDDILKLKEQISGCTENIIEYNNNMNKLDLTDFEKQIASVEEAYKQVKSIREKVNEDNVVDRNGGITEQGYSAIMLDNEMIKANKAQLEIYNSAVNELTRLYNEGSVSQAEYVSELNKYREVINNLANDNKSLEQDILSIKEKSFEAIKSAYAEQIRLQKEAIDKEEELRRAKKNAQKDDESLARKKILAQQLSQSDSVKDQKKAKQLLDEIKKAEDDREEERLQKLAEDKKDALDEEQKNLEKNLDDQLDAIKRSGDKQQEVINSMLGEMSNNYTSTMTNINTMIAENSLMITDNLTSQWQTASTSIQTYIDLAMQAVALLNGTGVSGGTSKSDRISEILTNGNGQGAGTSDLNKAIIANGGKQISYNQMAEIAGLLGLGTFTGDQVKGNTNLKNNILSMLQSSGYLKNSTIGSAQQSDSVIYKGISTALSNNLLSLKNVQKQPSLASMGASALLSGLKLNQANPVFSPNISVNVEGSADEKTVAKITSNITKQIIPVVNDYIRKRK